MASGTGRAGKPTSEVAWHEGRLRRILSGGLSMRLITRIISVTTMANRAALGRRGPGESCPPAWPAWRESVRWRIPETALAPGAGRMPRQRGAHT